MEIMYDELLTPKSKRRLPGPRVYFISRPQHIKKETPETPIKKPSSKDETATKSREKLRYILTSNGLLVDALGVPGKTLMIKPGLTNWVLYKSKSEYLSVERMVSESEAEKLLGMEIPSQEYYDDSPVVEEDDPNEPRPPAPDKEGYEVFVDDNFNLRDSYNQYSAGKYSSLDEARKAAMEIVALDLLVKHEKGMTGDDLYNKWSDCGENPFISGETWENQFSARDFAKKLAAEICSAKED